MRLKNSLSKTFLLLFITLSIASPLQAKKNKKIFGYIDKKPIYEEELIDRNIHELKKQLYELQLSKFKIVALKELNKNKKGFTLSPDQEISEQEIKNFYQLNGLESRASLKEIAPKIREFLEKQLAQTHLTKEFARAEKMGLIKVNLKDPGAFLINIPIETAYTWGNKKTADVFVLEFSDYQCPFCSKVQPTINYLRKNYSNRVAFGYRHMPLPFHQEADEAAIAAECARDQNKFASYHEELFKNPVKYTNSYLKDLAKKVRINNQKQFNNCLDQEKYRPQLNADMLRAKSVGITGTPAFIIGRYNKETNSVEGELIAGAYPLPQFVKLIEKYLNEK